MLFKGLGALIEREKLPNNQKHKSLESLWPNRCPESL
jgi:hypothetical protein